MTDPKREPVDLEKVLALLDKSDCACGLMPGTDQPDPNRLCQWHYAEKAEVLNAAIQLADEVRELRLDNGTLEGLRLQRVADDREITRLRAALETYGEHTRDCALYLFEGCDPERGWKYNGKWTEKQPDCTCGLSAALAGEGE